MKKYSSFWSQLIYFTSFFLLLLFNNTALAQYSNSWIDYDQQYVKVGVLKRGIYKVDFETLKQNGLKITEENKPNLKVYYRGNEVSTFSINNQYLAFYGEPNDGSSDSLLFRPTSARENRYYSLFSDEGFYFITLGKTEGKKASRTPVQSDNNGALLNWHWAEKLLTFPEEYTYHTTSVELPPLQQSYLTNQETFASKPRSGITNETHTLDLKNPYYSSSNLPELTVMVNSRTNGWNKIDLSANNKSLTTFNFMGIKGSTYKTTIDPIASDQNKVEIGFKSSLTTGRYAITYIRLLYPQLLEEFSSLQENLLFKILDSSIHTVQLKNTNQPQVEHIALDISKPYDIKIIPTVIEGDKIKFQIIGNNTSKTEVLISPLNSIYEINSISSVRFEKIVPEEIDFLMITNSYLKGAADQYKEYRKSKQGGSHKVHLADIANVYDEFNYGEPSPLAIRNYVKYLLSDKNWNKNLLLIGQATTVPARLNKGLVGVYDNNPKYSSYLQVPSIGYPGSDVLLVDKLDSLSQQDVPALPVGRIVAMEHADVLNYLEKVKEFESSNSHGWKKNVLHVSGGHSIEEINSFKNILQQFEPLITNGLLGGYVHAFVKPNLNPTQNVNLSPHVNNGVGVISYFGHGNAIITDYNIGYASPAQNQINNKGRYPFMFFNGCGVGNIFGGRYQTQPGLAASVTLSTDWIIAKDKGAIAILANSFDSYTSTSTKYLQVFKKLLYEKGDILGIGQLQRLAAYAIAQNGPSAYDIANLHQTVLQGDPSIKIFQMPYPDYTISGQEDFIISSTNDTSIEEASDLELKVLVRNLGRYNQNQDLPVRINFKYEDYTESSTEVKLSSIAYSDTLKIVIRNEKPISEIKVELDKNNVIKELDDNNNIYTLLIDWNEIKQLKSFIPEIYLDKIPPVISVRLNDKVIGPSDVLNNSDKINIQVEDNQSLNMLDKEHIDIYIKKSNQQDFIKFNDLVAHFYTQDNKSYTEISLKDLDEGDYELLIVGKDQSGNISQPYQAGFKLRKDFIQTSPTLVVSPNPASSFVKFDLNNHEEAVNEKVSYSIFNVNGAVLESGEVNMKNNKATWYWYPYSSGIYFYQVRLHSPFAVEFTGKIVVTK